MTESKATSGIMFSNQRVSVVPSRKNALNCLGFSSAWKTATWARFINDKWPFKYFAASIA